MKNKTREKPRKPPKTAKALNKHRRIFLKFNRRSSVIECILFTKFGVYPTDSFVVNLEQDKRQIDVTPITYFLSNLCSHRKTPKSVKISILNFCTFLKFLVLCSIKTKNLIKYLDLKL